MTLKCVLVWCNGLLPIKNSFFKVFLLSCEYQVDVQGRIREALAETVRGEQDPAQRPPSGVDYLEALQRRGIIDDVMKELHFSQVGRQCQGFKHVRICLD